MRPFRLSSSSSSIISSITSPFRHVVRSCATGSASSTSSTTTNSKHRLLHFPEAYDEILTPTVLESSNTTASSSTASSSSSSTTIAVPFPARAPISNANKVPIRAWFDNVPVEREALSQLEVMSSSLNGVIRHPIAVMPDCHWGNGATVGTVLPVYKAVIPAAVGVDIGCGLTAVKTTLREADLPSDCDVLRVAIELAVPHGRTHNGQPENDAGSWRGNLPRNVANAWKNQLDNDFRKICARRPEIERSNHIGHCGTLGTGNHHCELLVEKIDDAANAANLDDEETRTKGGHVWLSVHSGSRGVGARIGNVFIELAKKDMGSLLTNLPNQDMAYLKEGTAHFDEYVFAVNWAQKFAFINRQLMIENMIAALKSTKRLPPFEVVDSAIETHHNYVERTVLDDGTEVMLTRKGAMSAKAGQLSVLPGTMGTSTFIVRGKGNPLSYNSAAHGAGRKYSRGETMRRFTVEDHERATAGVACRKDKDVVDETPAAYKDVHQVLAAQSDLVEVVAELKVKVCIKG